MEIKSWIHAARLRTLPLSLSGIIVGSFVAYKQGFWDNRIFALAILTTLFLQILSNFANDLGDSYKGADNEGRVGPMRAIQSGKITQKGMIFGSVVMSVLSLVTAIPLIIIGTTGMPSSVLWAYVVLALLSVLAAITYTVGKKAYGYNGMGDVMVFIFFGLVSVLGVYSLYSKQFDWGLLGMAIGIGMLSIAVLNLNNMRDHENDKLVNKRTIVVSMGFEKAKIYHTFLIVGSFIGILTFILLNEWWLSLIALFPYIILTKHLSKVWKTKIPQTLDPELKKVALSTFAISILFLISTVL
ncbi:1,4-dihydroxy-2-naphthoate octaprenyltransferase [Brumimicrobium oceani]|uniref:1,4-dihydroxy-2-naphthoate octaprenyltransferase n=1 Tax=Brumimicrobium oceani TaxID=2100725 RepID=A0A2U2XDN6_9FLAO|nr:1,4-dihydroxy-2-naphthoate octaprenyltransferase [Brumimicrobium oceani]PWH85915.1 1,4-dihydroxy-2-naphthoate octaprenyltransferase [Brumimicrobium oceani]